MAANGGRPARAPYWIALAVIVACGMLAAAEVWPFDMSMRPLDSSPSMWQLILGDRVTVGFVQAGIAASAVYLLTSIVVRASRSEWLTLSRGRAETTRVNERVGEGVDSIEALKRQLEKVTKQRDNYAELAVEERAKVKECERMCDDLREKLNVLSQTDSRG